MTMGELCTHLTIERVRLETLALKCARQFSTLLERGHWKSIRQGNSLVAYSTARAVLRGLRLASTYSPAVCNGGPDKA